MAKIDVENTEARLLVGPPLDEGTAELRFLPGINHVEEKHWAQTKQNKNVQTWMKLGWLKEHGEQPASDEVEIPHDLDVLEAVSQISAMSVPEAVAIIEKADITHKEFLEALAERDNREAIKMAAKLQLDKLKGE